MGEEAVDGHYHTWLCGNGGGEISLRLVGSRRHMKCALKTQKGALGFRQTSMSDKATAELPVLDSSNLLLSVVDCTKGYSSLTREEGIELVDELNIKGDSNPSNNTFNNDYSSDFKYTHSSEQYCFKYNFSLYKYQPSPHFSRKSRKSTLKPQQYIECLLHRRDD